MVAKRTSPPVWVAWIEIITTSLIRIQLRSPPVWVAWIEIWVQSIRMFQELVATRMGGVD